MLLRDIKHIKTNNKSKETQKGTNLFLGGKAEIIIPPIRAPKPSSDTINPTSKALNENFSIIRIPIKERNGRPKILNNGVKEITFIRFGFFEISNRTSLRDPKYEFIFLEFLLWSFS